MKNLEEKLHQGNLFDFYGDLLKPGHRRIFESYVCEDLSLAEIAETEGMSRQGVHDVIRRETKRMEHWEEHLQLISRFEKMRSGLEEIEQCAESDQIKRMARRLLRQL